MKICLVHNHYGKYSGEEAVFDQIHKLLTFYGHEVVVFERSSVDIQNMYFGKSRSFFSGIYNPASRYRFREFLRNKKPELIHIHNLFPLISPSVLPEARSTGIPVVMTVHNYRLVCPNGLHYVNGEVCERCIGGHEYWCILKNCERKIIKSLGYAIRNWWARKQRYYIDNIDVYACLTEFQRNKLIQAGFSEYKIIVVPNMAKIEFNEKKSMTGEYVGFSGRLSQEKGVAALVATANNNRDIPFYVAGNYNEASEFINDLPENLKLLGFLNKEKIESFYQKTRIFVLPSVCYEGFPVSIVEAMLHGKPVICSRIGGLPEIVDDGVTGLLVDPGNSSDLSAKIRYLWHHPELCHKMGRAGRVKALREYSDIKYYMHLHDQPYLFYRMAKEAYKAVPEIDAIFITCLCSPARKVINILEKETGKPVISSCSASLYGVLKQLGIRETIEDQLDEIRRSIPEYMVDMLGVNFVVGEIDWNELASSIDN